MVKFKGNLKEFTPTVSRDDFPRKNHMRYFIGILLVAVGIFLVLKTEWFIQNFGTNAWAEEHLGYNGGTRLMYKLVGIIMIFFGFLAITNLLSGFLTGTVGKIFVR